MLSTAFYRYPVSRFSAQSILIHPEDSYPAIHILLLGTVKQYSIGKNGDELVATVYKPGSYFPLLPALTTIPNRYYFSALEDGEVIKAPAEEVVTLLKDNASLSFDLLSRLFKGMDGLLSRLESIAVGDAQTRVAVFLMITAKRFGVVVDERRLQINLTHQDIAAATGLNRETVTRALGHLKDKGLIESEHGHLIVNNINELESLAITS